MASVNCLPLLAVLAMRVHLSLKYSGTIIEDEP
jgi:hypothetical protein